jgi:hypothetical protein
MAKGAAFLARAEEIEHVWRRGPLWLDAVR